MGVDGYVGIGVIDPLEKLDVNGNVNINGSLHFNYNPGNTGQVLVSNGSGIAPTWKNISGVTPGSGYGYSGYSGLSGYSGYSGSSASLSASDNTGLLIDSGIVSTIYNTTISDSVSSIAVGGAVPMAASDWKTKNIVQVLDTILFPDQLPTYTIPTITLGYNQSGIKEIGSSLSQILTSTASKNDAGIFTQLLFKRNNSSISITTNPTSSSATNIADQFGYSDPNNPNIKYVYNYTDSITVTSGSITWITEGNYNAGLAKQNNKGVTDIRTPAVRNINAPQASSTGFGSSSISINGIYPYFWGKSSTQPTTATIAAAISGGSANKVLVDASGTVTITYNASNEWIWLAHYSTYTSKIQWYFDALNKGSIGDGQFILSPVTQNINSPDGYWSNISFKIYISGYATSTSGPMNYNNTIV